MKKFLVFILFVFLTICVFGQNKDTYVGSSYYRPIVGGLYQKGNTVGAVFYVDDTRNIMKLLCVESYDVMGDDTWTYTNLERNLKKHGWKLLNKNVCEEFVSNMPTIENNETLYKNKHYRFLHAINIAMESEPNGNTVNVFNPFSDSRRYESTWRYLHILNYDGSETIEELGGFCVTGWREVPLEPQYVTHFSR